MPIDPSFLDSLQSVLGNALVPGLTSSSDPSDIFEAYIFSLVVKAARDEGATVSFRDVFGKSPSVFVFRTSPGYISSTTQPYTYAIIQFSNKPILEVHIGVRVEGASGVLHECDVAVIHQSEAELCRKNAKIHPRYSKVELAIECKFYTTKIKLGLVRSFVGLISDLSKEQRYFVVNTSLDSAASITAYLSKLTKGWEHNIVPGSTMALLRLTGSFQNAFKNFKAKKIKR